MTRMRSAHNHPTAGCACMGGLTITVKRPLNISRGGIFSPPNCGGGGGQEKNGEPLAHVALLQNGFKMFSKNHSSLGMHKQRRDGHPLRHFAPHGPGLAAAG